MATMAYAAVAWPTPVKVTRVYAGYPDGRIYVAGFPNVDLRRAEPTGTLARCCAQLELRCWRSPASPRVGTTLATPVETMRRRRQRAR